jgi:hypothetical protein
MGYPPLAHVLTHLSKLDAPAVPAGAWKQSHNNNGLP